MTETFVPIDPSDAPGVCDNIRRTAAEIARWRGRPYVVTLETGFEVRCLDGLRSDRPTVWAVVPTLAQALQIASGN